MPTGKRLLKFGGGGLLGTAVGGAVALLWAPQSGDELKGRVVDLLRRARLAGAEAKVAKEEALIGKFRADVDDPTALRDEEAKARLEAAQAVAEIGPGSSMPGTLVSQEKTVFVSTTPLVSEHEVSKAPESTDQPSVPTETATRPTA